MLLFVPVDQIDDNPFQARTEYGEIEDLADRIAAARSSYPGTRGLMQVPRGRVVVVDTDTIVDADSVRMFASDGQWREDPATFRIQLAFGHRRFRAYRHLHRTGAAGYEDGRFPVHIDGLTDEQMLDAVWAENRERKNISAVEEAELLARKLERAQATGGSQRDVAEAWGLARATVANRLRLLQLPAELQEANRTGRMSERQCLALLPVLKLEEAAPAGVEWSGREAGDIQPWETPAAPAAFVQYAASAGVTSDDIRDYMRHALNHAGTPLPDQIARHTFADLSDVQQPACKRCPARINSTCLDSACLATKRQAYIDHRLALASADLGYPVSDKASDFEAYESNPDLRRDLTAAHEAGADGAFVIGWRPHGFAARPYTANSYAHNTRTLGDEAIALGYRGDLVVVGDTNAAPDPAEQRHARIMAWRDEAEVQEVAARRTAITAIADVMAAESPALQSLMALMFEPSEWPPENGPRNAVHNLWRWGAWSAEWHKPRFLRMQEMLDRAGIGREILEDDDPIREIRNEAIRALAWWYQNANAWSTNEDATDIALDMLVEIQPDLDEAAKSYHQVPELAELADAVNHVLQSQQRSIE